MSELIIKSKKVSLLALLFNLFVVLTRNNGYGYKLEENFVSESFSASLSISLLTVLSTCERISEWC